MIVSEHGCTGISAGWCPVHGDCTCPDRTEAMDSEDCPLHASWSTHGEPQEASAVATMWGVFPVGDE